jgi:hypothetical protein
MIGALEDFMAASELDAALDAQIERLVSELESHHSRAQIQRIVEQCAARYRDAHVTTFIPISPVSPSRPNARVPRRLPWLSALREKF